MHEESVFTKSSALNILPFTMDQELSDKLKNLKNNSDHNLVEICITSEEMSMASCTKTQEGGLGLSQYVDSDEPRFLALCVAVPNSIETMTFLIFSCPETAPVRMKMIMASSKATLISLSASLGLTFDR
jgi:hypothetical protein